MNKALSQTIFWGIVTSLVATYLWEQYRARKASGQPFTITPMANGTYTHDLYDFIDKTPYIDNNGVIYN